MTPRCEWYFRLSDSNISAKSKLNAKYCSMFIRVQMGSNHELIYVYKISWHTPFNVTVFKSFNFQIWLMKSPKWMSLDWSLIIRILLFSFFPYSSWPYDVFYLLAMVYLTICIINRRKLYTSLEWHSPVPCCLFPISEHFLLFKVLL